MWKNKDLNGLGAPAVGLRIASIKTMGHALCVTHCLIPGEHICKVSIAMWWDKIRKVWTRNNQQHFNCHLLQRSPLRRQHGQSLVEFAIILPVLLLLVLGTIDLGLGFKTYIVLTNVAREGARTVTIYPTNQTLAIERIRGGADTIGLSDALVSDRGDQFLP